MIEELEELKGLNEQEEEENNGDFLLDDCEASFKTEKKNLPLLLLFLTIAITMAIVFLVHSGGRERTDSSTLRSAVDFDVYVLAMSHQPAFCSSQDQRPPGCRHPREFWKYHLTIHGLWPSYSNGGWPSDCASSSDEEIFNHTILAPLIPQLERFWPNVKAKQSPDAKHFYDFWQYEWGKHGTCSTLSCLDYFEAALHNILPTPQILSQNYGGSVSKLALLEAYRINDDERRPILGKEDANDVVLICQRSTMVIRGKGLFWSRSKVRETCASNTLPIIEPSGSFMRRR